MVLNIGILTNGKFTAFPETTFVGGAMPSSLSSKGIDPFDKRFIEVNAKLTDKKNVIPGIIQTEKIVVIKKTKKPFIYSKFIGEE